MDEQQKRKFHLFIMEEEKSYVCANCGTYTMRTNKLNFISDYEADVTLKCKRCGWEWERKITYFD